MSGVRFDRGLLAERLSTPGLRGVGSRYRDGREEYVCFECGHCWRPRERYFWWPVNLLWSWPAGKWLSVHGVECGADRIEQRVYKRVVRVGPLVIVLGPLEGCCQ